MNDSGDAGVRLVHDHAACMREISLDLHSGLKNPAEALLLAILEYERLRGANAEEACVQADLVMQTGKVLIARISQYVEATRSAQVHPGRSTREVTFALLRLFASDVVERYGDPVLEELDPASVGRLDNNLLTGCLSELVTNAVVADTPRLVVRSTLDVEEGVSWVEVRVLCFCSTPLRQGQPREGTLGLLANRLRRYGGSLFVHDHGPGGHESVCRWPAGTPTRGTT